MAGLVMRGHGFASMLSAGLEPLLNVLSPRTRVLIMGSVPELDQIAPDCVFRTELYGYSRFGCAMAHADVEARLGESVRALQSLAANRPNTLFIDPMKVFCDGRRCLPFGDRGLFYSDENHLTPLGAEMIYNGFQPEFRWAFGN